MQSRVLLGLAAVALGLTAYAYVATRPPAAPQVASVVADTGARSAHANGPLDDQTVANALQRAFGPPPDPEVKLPPAEARRVAEESFELMMHTLEELADADRRVPRARREQLYRDTNDVFSALSAQLDPHDAADMQLLEDANIRMKAMLSELGVTVPKPRRPPRLD